MYYFDLSEFGYTATPHYRGTAILARGDDPGNYHYFHLRRGLEALGDGIVEMNHVDGDLGWVETEYVLNMPFHLHEELVAAHGCYSARYGCFIRFR